MVSETAVSNLWNADEEVSLKSMLGYDRAMHIHIFACWTSARAASVRRPQRGITVHCAERWLSSAGLKPSLKAEKLSAPSKIDQQHQSWCENIIDAAKTDDRRLKHGQAAKLVNVYCKARYLSEQTAYVDRVNALHPPIDRILLTNLAQENFGGKAEFWRSVLRSGWSNLTLQKYTECINLMREGLGNQPLWQIENFWRPHDAA